MQNFTLLRTLQLTHHNYKASYKALGKQFFLWIFEVKFMIITEKRSIGHVWVSRKFFFVIGEHVL